jgi:HAE1 family hydrophobic/amphiphilic exporter-1
MITQASDRDDLNKLGAIPISLGTTGFTRVSQVADVVRASAPSSISRQDRQRTLGVQASVAGRTLGEVADDVRTAVAKIPLLDGYQIVVGGAVQSLDTAFGALLSALSLSVLLIYMLMVALYENWLYPLVIMFALPLALVGAFVGLVLTGNTLNLFSMIGIIMLMGLVAKNGILLVDYTNTLRSRGLDRNAAIIEAGPTRLKPIIMTSFTICFAMMPLALKLESGAESRAPLAVVVIGGVISSTTLTLFFVPTMYTYLDAVSNFFGRIFRRGHHEDAHAVLAAAGGQTVPVHNADGSDQVAPNSSANGSTGHPDGHSNGNTVLGEEIPNTGARPRRWGIGKK